MRDLIQTLGDLQQQYVRAVGTPQESSRQFEVFHLINRMVSDEHFMSLLKLPPLKYADMNNPKDQYLVISVKLLLMYQQFRNLAEHHQETLPAGDIENLYHASTAFKEAADMCSQMIPLQ